MPWSLTILEHPAGVRESSRWSERSGEDHRKPKRIATHPGGVPEEDWQILFTAFHAARAIL